jgi:hypothetical protein
MLYSDMNKVVAFTAVIIGRINIIKRQMKEWKNVSLAWQHLPKGEKAECLTRKSNVILPILVRPAFGERL